jgi:hypothetical protein
MQRSSAAAQAPPQRGTTNAEVGRGFLLSSAEVTQYIDQRFGSGTWRYRIRLGGPGDNPIASSSAIPRRNACVNACSAIDKARYRNPQILEERGTVVDQQRVEVRSSLATDAGT